MNKNKTLLLILIALLIGLLLLNINRNGRFNKPDFDRTSEKINLDDYEKKSVKVTDGYIFYVSPNPKIKNGYINVDFVSLCDDNIYLKLRVFENENLIAESGLIKKGEIIKKLKIKNSNVKKIMYVVMSYEKDTYYSLGEIKLKAKVGR